MTVANEHRERKMKRVLFLIVLPSLAVSCAQVQKTPKGELKHYKVVSVRDLTGSVSPDGRHYAFTGQALIVTVPTRSLDIRRSDLRREVKAITYHELAIRSIPGGVEATIIVDI